MGGKKNDGLIAHIRQSDNKEQSLWEHLEQTSQIAGQLSEKIGLGELGEILGVLHDFGKANQRFQNYIRSAEGQINPDADEYINSVSMKGKIDHSTMGAQILYDKLISRGKRGEITAQVMAICIASHHSGLIDFLSTDGENIFKKRIEKQETRSQLPSILSVMGDPFKEFSESYLSDVEETLLQKMQSLKETGF
jgi:CRISPR-associated endonuclease/helicase Cas3